MAFFGGKPAYNEQLTTVTPQQAATNQQANTNSQQLMNYLISNLMGGPQGQGRFDFAPIAQRARTQFEQQTIPSIAERFNALGGGRGSGFQQTLGAAGAGLEEGLAAQESQYGLQQQGLLQSLLGQLLGAGGQQQFENLYHPAQPGFAQSFLPGLIGAGVGAFGGPLAGAAGSALASALFGSIGKQAEPQKTQQPAKFSNPLTSANYGSFGPSAIDIGGPLGNYGKVRF